MARRGPPSQREGVRGRAGWRPKKYLKKKAHTAHPSVKPGIFLSEITLTYSPFAKS